MHYAYQLQLDKALERFSLTSVRLSVGEFRDRNGTTVKGMSLLGAGIAPLNVYEHVALLSRDGIEQLVSFFGEVLRNDLPAYFCADAGHGKRLRWRIEKFMPKWHEGGAYTGWLYLARLPLGFLHPTYSTITVTSETLKRLTRCLTAFYEIDS